MDFKDFLIDDADAYAEELAGENRLNEISNDAVDDVTTDGIENAAMDWVEDVTMQSILLQEAQQGDGPTTVDPTQVLSMELGDLGLPDWMEDSQSPSIGTYDAVDGRFVNTFVDQVAPQNGLSPIAHEKMRRAVFESTLKEHADGMMTPNFDIGPLPNGWDLRITQKGNPYYVDHNTQKTTWDDPRLPTYLDENLFISHSTEHPVKVDWRAAPIERASEKEAFPPEIESRVTNTAAISTWSDPVTKPIIGPFGDLKAYLLTTPPVKQQMGIKMIKNLRKFGFFNITNHGLRHEAALRWSKKFFDLPLHDKQTAAHPQGHILHGGYFWPAHEGMLKALCQASTSDPSNRPSPDLNVTESYTTWSEDNPNGPKAQLPDTILPGFQDFMSEFCLECDSIAVCILNVIARGLGVSQADFFQKTHNGSNSYLRLFRYPPTAAGSKSQSSTGTPIRRDCGSLAIRFRDGNKVLQFEDPQNPAKANHVLHREDSVMVNVGRGMGRWSNDMLKAPMHQAKFSQEHSYEIIYYVNPDDDALIKCLPTCIDGEKPAKYEPTTWYDFQELLKAERKLGG